MDLSNSIKTGSKDNIIARTLLRRRINVEGWNLSNIYTKVSNKQVKSQTKGINSKAMGAFLGLIDIKNASSPI